MQQAVDSSHREHFERGPLVPSLTSAQESFKSGLHEVLVMREGGANPFLFHNEEARAVRHAPTLISHLAVSQQRGFELLMGLGTNDHHAIAPQGLHGLRGGLTLTRPAVAKTVQKLGENHFAGHDFIQWISLGNVEGFSVKLIPRIEQCNPVAGIGEDSPHQDFAGLPYR